MDRISSLPDIATENILKCLSLRDAVRTSVLSHGWREQWCTIPQLIFDEKGFPRSRNETRKNYEFRLRRIVDQVLLLHQGPINKFKLSIARSSCRDIGRWIHFLSRHGVEEFIFRILRRGELYRLPFYFFSLKELTYLELEWCMFDPPSCFSGYSRLTVLDLSNIVFIDDGLGLLVSLCPLLRKMLLTDITDFSTCTNLRINSHNLVELSIDGGYILLYLEYAPLLAKASIACLDHLCKRTYFDETEPNIVNVFGYLPSIERLTIHCYTLESFAEGDIPVKLPVLLPLSHLSIHINFACMKEISAAFCIFRSSLMLEKLDIKAVDLRCRVNGGGNSDDFWQAQAQEDFSSAFNHLQVVKIATFTGTSNFPKFIELIIANAPILERLEIKFLSDVDESEILKMLHELECFPRSSTKAEIIVSAA